MIRGFPAYISANNLASFVWVILLSVAYPVHCETIGWQQYNTYGDANAVIEKQSQIINSEAGQAGPFIVRGNAYFELRDFESAVLDFNQAIEINSQADLAYFGRGMALGRMGKIDEAIIDLSIYITRNPKSSVGYTKRGIRYFWKNDKENAEKDFSMAIKLDPNNAEAHDDLGVIHAQRGDFDNAIKLFSSTLRLDPTYQKGYHNLAMAYFITGKNAVALEMVNGSLDLTPQAKNSLMLKGNILQSLGLNEEAAEAFEAAEFAPDANWSESAAVQ